MKVAGVQLELAWQDRDTNLARAARRIREAAGAGAELVVLPEMFPCGFSMDTARVSEPPDGPSTEFLRAQSQEHGVFVCGSIPVRAPTEALPSNTFTLAAPDGRLWRYQKLHPFSFAKEHEHYASGQAFLRVGIHGLRCCFFICYDLRFADEFWVNAEQTDVFVVVANWPERRRAHWRTLLLARAIENQCYVVGVNRVGSGDGLDYAGDSAIVDPWGEQLATAAGGETILYAELHAGVVQDARARFPVLQDRRRVLPSEPPR